MGYAYNGFIIKETGILWVMLIKGFIIKGTGILWVKLIKGFIIKGTGNLWVMLIKGFIIKGTSIFRLNTVMYRLYEFTSHTPN